MDWPVVGKPCFRNTRKPWTGYPSYAPAGLACEGAASLFPFDPFRRGLCPCDHRSRAFVPLRTLTEALPLRHRLGAFRSPKNPDEGPPCPYETWREPSCSCDHDGGLIVPLRP